MANPAIRYARFNPLDQPIEEALITCYQKVFAGPPWNETWERDAVRTDIRNEMKEKSSCWLASDGGAVVGFAWGYLHRSHQVG